MKQLNALQRDALFADHPFDVLQTRKFKGRWRYRAVLSSHSDQNEVTRRANALGLDHEWGGKSLPFLYYDNPRFADLLFDTDAGAIIRRCMTRREAVALDQEWRSEFRNRVLFAFDSAPTEDQVVELLGSSTRRVTQRRWARPQYANDQTPIVLAVLTNDRFAVTKLKLNYHVADVES